MGRPKKKGARIGNRLSRALAAIMDRNPPSPHIIARRERFSFGTPTKGGNIDQDVCDALGQMHRLGLLDGREIDALDMRNVGREYWGLWQERYPEQQARSGQFEVHSKTTGAGSIKGLNQRDDRRFLQLDRAILSADKEWLLTLTETADEVVPWALALINEALLKRGIVAKFAKFPTCEDRARLASVCRGLCALAGGASLERRRMAA